MLNLPVGGFRKFHMVNYNWTMLYITLGWSPMVDDVARVDFRPED